VTAFLDLADPSFSATGDEVRAAREQDWWARTNYGIAVLRYAEVRALLADRLEPRPTRANFRTGHLTVCTLVPMRSVPHRVVCLLGLDDGTFPRKAPRDGDDLLLREPHVGERDARTGEYVVKSGLAEGDQVIRYPSAMLKDGQTVQAAGPAKSSMVSR
jgi:hypothetical protein